MIKRWLALTVALVACSPGILPPPVAEVYSEPCGDPSVGTGVFVEADLLITNAHVVAGSDEVTVTLEGGSAVDGQVVGFDPTRDLAAIRVPAGAATPLPFGTGEPNDVGALWSLDAESLSVPTPYTINRIITATGNDIYDESPASRQALELATSLAQGQSGAPVVNEDGYLVGIAFAESQQQESISYAVTTAELEAFLAEHDLAQHSPTGHCL